MYLRTYKKAWKRRDARGTSTCLYANKKYVRNTLNRRFRRKESQALHKTLYGEDVLMPIYKPGVWWEIW